MIKHPQIFNLHAVARVNTSDDVYCGRPGPFGNPFNIGPGMTRDQACNAFDAWIELKAQAELKARIKRELRGKNLLCWCVPERCHCETLRRIANAP